MAEDVHSISSYGNDDKSALQAKFEAQKIAFAPIMFKAALSLKNLGILNIIQDNRKHGITTKEISKTLKLSNYGVKVLLEAGLSLEIVYLKNNKFFLTKTGWFLINDKLTEVNINFTNDVNYLGFDKLEESVLSGKPKGLEVFGNWETIYEGLSQLPEKAKKSWFEFDQYYSDAAFPTVLPIILKNNPKKGLDIGGNTGKFSIKCVKKNPNLEMTILDLPGQITAAQKNISNKGLSDKIKLISINLSNHSIPYPGKYDFIWMSQFLDCFSQKDIIKLLERSKKALNSDGSIFILETYWDDQIYPASTYSLHATSLYFTCMANGNSQMYHHNDMLKLIKKSGLKVTEEYKNIGVGHTLYKCNPV